MPRSFSTADVLCYSGATESQVTWWTNQGLIVPDIKKAKGRGFRPEYSLLNIVEVAVAAELAKYRLTLDVMRAPLGLLRFLAQTARLDELPLQFHIEMDTANGAYDNLRRYYLNAVSVMWPLIREEAQSYGMDSVETLAHWVALWRGVATPQWRTAFAFADLVYSAGNQTTSFVVQPREGALVGGDWLSERSLVTVNLIPILNAIEAAAQETLHETLH